MATESDPTKQIKVTAPANFDVTKLDNSSSHKFRPSTKQSDPIEQVLVNLVNNFATLYGDDWWGHDTPLGDCKEDFAQALTAIRQEVERICLEVIGANYSMKGYSRSGGKGYAIKFANDTKDVERQRLAAALRGLEGK